MPLSDKDFFRGSPYDRVLPKKKNPHLKGIRLGGSVTASSDKCNGSSRKRFDMNERFFQVSVLWTNHLSYWLFRAKQGSPFGGKLFLLQFNHYILDLLFRNFLLTFICSGLDDRDFICPVRIITEGLKEESFTLLRRRSRCLGPRTNAQGVPLEAPKGRRGIGFGGFLPVKHAAEPGALPLGLHFWVPRHSQFLLSFARKV